MRINLKIGENAGENGNHLHSSTESIDKGAMVFSGKINAAKCY